MKIRYDVTIDDIVAFQRYHLAHSPAMKRRKALVTWVLPTLVLGLCCLFAFLDKSPHLVLLGAVFSIVYVLITLISGRLHTRKLTRKLYSEGANKAVLGFHQLELTDQGITERTQYSELTSSWEAVEKIVSTDHYTFIYIGAISAHVIPRASVIEGDYEAFAAAANEHLSRARGCASP